MSKENRFEAFTTGRCLLAMWHICILAPIWLLLQYAVLNSLGDYLPRYAWGLYWAYVPAYFVGVIASAIWSILRDVQS